jgi:hypothetical protein
VGPRACVWLARRGHRRRRPRHLRRSAKMKMNTTPITAALRRASTPTSWTVDKWAQAVRWQSSSYAPAFTFGAGMVESFGEPSVSSPALPTADGLTAEAAGQWLALGDAPALDEAARRAELAAATLLSLLSH